MQRFVLSPRYSFLGMRAALSAFTSSSDRDSSCPPTLFQMLVSLHFCVHFRRFPPCRMHFACRSGREPFLQLRLCKGYVRVSAHSIEFSNFVHPPSPSLSFHNFLSSSIHSVLVLGRSSCAFLMLLVGSVFESRPSVRVFGDMCDNRFHFSA